MILVQITDDFYIGNYYSFAFTKSTEMNEFGNLCLEERTYGGEEMDREYINKDYLIIVGKV